MAELPDNPEIKKLPSEVLTRNIDDIAIKKAFISGKSDRAILGYFRRKKKFLATESIAEIDRRYFPIGRLHIKSIREYVESKDYAYVNLNNGELYYVKDHGIKTGSNLIKKILELPEDAKKNLFNLIAEGSMDMERFGSKDIAGILERRGLARVYSIRKPTLSDIIVGEITSSLQSFATGKAVVSSIPVVEKRRIRKRMGKIKINKFYNLDNFLDTRIPESGFDPDKIIYNPKEVIEVISRLLKRDVVYEDSVYLPYYRCKYVTRKGTRYLTLISPKFRG